MYQCVYFLRELSPPPDEPDDPEDEAGAGDGHRHQDRHHDRGRHPRLLRVVRPLLCSAKIGKLINFILMTGLKIWVSLLCSQNKVMLKILKPKFRGLRIALSSH